MIRVLCITMAKVRKHLKNAFAEAEHVDFHAGLEKQEVITDDGRDITKMVEDAVAWLTEHSF